MSDALKKTNAVLADVEIDLLRGIRAMGEEKTHRLAKATREHFPNAEKSTEEDEDHEGMVQCPECEGDGCDECDDTGYVSEDDVEYVDDEEAE